MEISAVIIDEERTFADALAIRLNAEEDLSVTAVAQPTATTMGWHADIILLDVDLTGSIRFCKATSRGPNETRVIMLSHTSEPPRIVAAIEAGARAWVRKDESVEHLLRVLRGVAQGETWLPPAETGNVLSLLLRQRDGREDNDRLLGLLTPRERQVLACLAEGRAGTRWLSSSTSGRTRCARTCRTSWPSWESIRHSKRWRSRAPGLRPRRGRRTTE